MAVNAQNLRQFNNSLRQSPQRQVHAFLPIMGQKPKRIRSINHKYATNRLVHTLVPLIQSKPVTSEMPVLLTEASPTQFEHRLQTNPSVGLKMLNQPGSLLGKYHSFQATSHLRASNK